MLRALIPVASAGVLLAGNALGETVTPVSLPDFVLNGTTPVSFTETLAPGGTTYGLRLQADWTDGGSAWSSEFLADISAPNGDSFGWNPVGGENSNAPFSFDVTRFLAFPFGTPGDGDWDFTFSSNYPHGVANLANVQVDLIEIETFEYSSATFHGGPTWFRPEGLGPDLSPLGPVNYDVQEFSVLEDGLYDIYSEHTGFDGILYLYAGGFDPLAPLDNLIAFNDDGRVSLTTSELIGLELNADETYFLVTSSYEACQTGNLRNVIGGTGGVVPEPTTAALLALSGLLLYRRR